MKKNIIFFILCASLLTFYSNYRLYDQKILEQFYLLDEHIGYEFFIPETELLADPDVIYPILADTSSDLQVNIFRSVINNKPDNQMEFMKYILLNQESTMFDNIKLESGRVLDTTDSQNKERYISTTSSPDSDQVGVIKEFGGNNNITIKPLISSYDYLPVSGYYYIETSENNLIPFLEQFSLNLREFYSQKGISVQYSPATFTIYNSTKVGFPSTSMVDVTNMLYILVIITAFYMLYYNFKETKRVGIYKLLGIPTLKIWYYFIGKTIVISSFINLFMVLVLSIVIPNSTVHFFFYSLYEQFKLLIIIVVLTLPSYIYISRTNIKEAIKNKKYTKIIFAMNTLLKISTTIIVISLFSTLSGQYNTLKSEQDDLESWKRSNQYGVFYPVNAGYDATDFQNSAVQYIRTTAGQLYPVLNELGSVLINSRQYEEMALLLNKNYEGIRSLQVNPNYLKEFPVYDTKGEPIYIPEEEVSWIILVPEKLKNQEKQIVQFFRDERDQRIAFEKEQLKNEISPSTEMQNIQIIWYANHQDIFSFNPDVYPNNNNLITEPIIQVITEQNSLVGDRDAILGNGSSDPIKIKLIDGDTAKTYRFLESTLKELKLDDNLHYLITVDQYIAEKVYALQQRFYSTSFALAISVLILCFLLIQNLSIMFNKFQQKFIIRGIFGLSIPRKYKEFIYIFGISWIIIGICCYLLGILNLALPISLFFALILLELCFSVVWLTRLSSKHIIKLLKGGQ
ncbi:bacteriocin-associated integral membrane family protein [Paenibacillus sp. USHLN196]|uniref:bacteriocin-associated integral membrane family protein n=1 Tax=Paenibacillus sp. USHLN196 TaxID=3081291 RepID=UPI0030175030